jgi:hypothetical protein
MKKTNRTTDEEMNAPVPDASSLARLNALMDIDILFEHVDVPVKIEPERKQAVEQVADIVEFNLFSNQAKVTLVETEAAPVIRVINYERTEAEETALRPQLQMIAVTPSQIAAEASSYELDPRWQRRHVIIPAKPKKGAVKEQVRAKKICASQKKRRIGRAIKRGEIKFDQTRAKMKKATPVKAGSGNAKKGKAVAKGSIKKSSLFYLLLLVIKLIADHPLTTRSSPTSRHILATALCTT